jgi:hypothetical protein
MDIIWHTIQWSCWINDFMNLIMMNNMFQWLTTYVWSTWEIWRACYIHENPSWKKGGNLNLLFNSGRDLLLSLDVRSLPLLNSRHKITHTSAVSSTCMLRLMISFISCFMVGKAHSWAVVGIPKMVGRTGLSHHLVQGHLFWKCPHSGVLLYTYYRRKIVVSKGKSPTYLLILVKTLCSG